MALDARELFSSSTQTFRSNWNATHVIVGEFLASLDSGAPVADLTLPVGTALAHNGTGWVLFDGGDEVGNGSAAKVDGFVFPDPVTINANGGDTVLGQIFLTGEVDYRELNVDHMSGTDRYGYTEAELKAELQANARGKGIIVKKLADIR